MRFKALEYKLDICTVNVLVIQFNEFGIIKSLNWFGIFRLK